MKFPNQEMMNNWWIHAQVDPTVYPYLSMSKYSKAIEVVADTWNTYNMMDKSERGLLSLSFDRSRDSASLALWVLNCKEKPFIAGTLIRLIPEILRRTGLKYLNSNVHESNIYSRNITEKYLGPHWGVEPKSAWNALSGVMEDTYYYRCRTEDLGKR